MAESTASMPGEPRHGPPGTRHILLEQGVRSPGWRLGKNIDRAEADGHPDPGLLRVLAEVLTESRSIEDLKSLM